ncbi:MAG TPA: NF038129 family PEP-CTERM protein [Bryobacteraceae bacterium]|jgi:hypothetical protein
MKLAHLFVFIAMAIGVRADIIYNVTLGPVSYSGAPPAPFSLAFEFADGSGVGDGNNSVTLSNFLFGGGGPSGSPFLSGSVTGDLLSSVVFTDAASTSVFFQGFTPGNSLSFTVDLTTNVDPGGIPDEFIMSLLDSSLSPIPTTSSSPLFPLLVVDIDSSNPTVQTFGSSGQPAVAGGGAAFGAPVVTPQAPSPVPEPASWALFATALVGVALWRRRQSRVIP